MADDENREVSEVSEGELEDSVVVTPSNQKSRTAETISLEIPSQRLSEVVASAADRSGLSIHQQLLIPPMENYWTESTSSGHSNGERMAGRRQYYWILFRHDC